MSAKGVDMSNAEVNEGYFEEEKAEAVAAERSRIYREVVEPLVEALERVERGGAWLADGSAVCMWCDDQPHMDLCPIGAALATAREQMGKP